EWEVRIAVDPYVRQSQQRCVATVLIHGLDKLVLENETYSWGLQQQIRLWAGRNVISHDDLNRDLGQFEKILERHGCARSDEKSIVGRERFRHFPLWERLINALVVHDRLHVRAPDGREAGKLSGLRVGHQDRRADLVEQGDERVGHDVCVVHDPWDVLLEKLMEPGLGKLCVREVLQKVRAQAKANKSRLVTGAVRAIGEDLSVEQGAECSIKGREAGFATPREIDDVHRKTPPEKNRLVPLPPVRRGLPGLPGLSRPVNEHERESSGVLRDLIVRIQMVDLEALPVVGSAADRGIKLSWRSNFSAAHEEASLPGDNYGPVIIFAACFRITRMRNGTSDSCR